MLSLRLFLVMGLLVLAMGGLMGQVKVSGRVFDMSQSIPLASVSVLSTGGTGTVTDSSGRYSIFVKETDSIWFSYLGRATPKYPVRTIPNTQSFEISLHVAVTELKQIMVKPPDYREDSIQNRLEYEKAFDFKKPGIGIATSPGGGVGMDLDQFIDMFHFQRNKRMLLFQERLIREEQDKFIDHRFSRALVIKITQLHGADLDSFMVHYRPTLLFTQKATDYEFQSYIKTCYQKYERYLKAMGELKKSDE